MLTLRSTGLSPPIYRDQLEELERDLSVGLIGKTEAAAARTEISRCLIAAADTIVAARKGKSSTWGRRTTIFAALVALPIGAISLYLGIGSPSASTQPGAALTAPSAMRLETAVNRDPNNGERWEEIARAYMQSDQYDNATIAWRNALRLLGESAERQSELGESMMAAANGIVTAEAQAAFKRAVALDHNMMIARFFLGMAAEQDGRREEAVEIWRNMITVAPADAPWLGLVRESLMRVETERAGPSADELWHIAKP